MKTRMLEIAQARMVSQRSQVFESFFSENNKSEIKREYDKT